MTILTVSLPLMFVIFAVAFYTSLIASVTALITKGGRTFSLGIMSMMVSFLGLYWFGPPAGGWNPEPEPVPVYIPYTVPDVPDDEFEVIPEPTPILPEPVPDPVLIPVPDVPTIEPSPDLDIPDGGESDEPQPTPAPHVVPPNPWLSKGN